MNEDTKSVEETTLNVDQSNEVINSTDDDLLSDLIAEESVNSTVNKTSERIKQKVTITEATSEKKTWDPNADTVILPADLDENTVKILQNSGLLDQLAKKGSISSKERADWIDAVRDGSDLNTFNEAFVKTLEDQNADFFQGIEVNGKRLQCRSAELPAMQNQKLSGEIGIFKLFSYLGHGSLVQIPLWHSGIWLTMKSPSEAAMIELHRLLISDKISFGRSDYGLPFSNVTTYTTDRLVNFALEHVWKATVIMDQVSGRDLKNIIVSQDIPSILWGLACTIYPRGFQFRRACISDPEKCSHITEEVLNLIKLQWTNKNALNDWQKGHMFDRANNSKSLDSIKRYQEEMKATQKRNVIVNKETDHQIEILLKVPTISEYVSAGYKWIGEIVDTVETAASSDLGDTEKEQLIFRHGQASVLRQYTHWVESITFGTNVIEDEETINETLTRLSSDNRIREDLLKEVSKYINESTISVIGIPVYDCVECGETQKSSLEIPGHANIIPLDVQRLFFALLSQRLLKMTER